MRRAFNLAFDFEEMNKTLFFGQYTRIKSYFDGTRARLRRTAAGPRARDPREVKDKVPPEVFTTPYTNPVNGNAEASATTCAKRPALLREAGWELQEPKLVNAKTGEPLRRSSS